MRNIFRYIAGSDGHDNLAEHSAASRYEDNPTDLLGCPAGLDNRQCPVMASVRPNLHVLDH